MSDRSKQIQAFIIESVSQHPHDLTNHIANHFQISPQAVLKHLKKLVEAGHLHKEGTTRNISYSLPAPRRESSPVSTPSGWVVASKDWSFSIGPELDEQDIWEQTLKTKFQHLRENVRDIVEYGFTEMVNNVKDHANAKHLTVSYEITDETLRVEVRDDGVGIFRKIRESLGLSTLREAILHLSKGKLTTDHTRHTGEGIFFSSRVFDKYFLSANGLMYGRINEMADEDWLIGEEKETNQGTRVSMSIALNSPRTREEVFRKFTSSEDFSFSKTHVAVELGMIDGETYVSRSQAKRIMSRLDKFRFIVLNFKRVKTVGQGFVDEVFRVYKNAHPDIQIDYVNANESVEFMIRRSLVE